MREDEGGMNSTEGQYVDTDEFGLGFTVTFEWVCYEAELGYDDACESGKHRAEGEQVDYAVWEELKTGPRIVGE